MAIHFQKMKIAVSFLTIVACVVALPAEVPFETPDELDLSKLTPNNIYLEPVNPVKNADLPESRIIGGSEVEPNSVPYQVAVIIDGSFLCGGSLISTTSVLTAAHCTISASFVQVRLGAHAFNQNEATQVRVTSTNIINHASYNVGSFAANDISVILLPSAVSLNANIQIIPLAPASASSYEGSSALLTGWGRFSASSNDNSPVLLGVNLNIISNTACTGFYGSNVQPTNICTSGAGIVGACNGDSGGPLAADGVQVGIVSFGSPNCEAGNPTVFARISAYRSWIQQNAGV